MQYPQPCAHVPSTFISQAHLSQFQQQGCSSIGRSNTTMESALPLLPPIPNEKITPDVATFSTIGSTSQMPVALYSVDPQVATVHYPVTTVQYDPYKLFHSHSTSAALFQV